MNASRYVRKSAMEPGAKSPSGVRSVSISLMNAHRGPAARRRSSPRFRRSTRAGAAAESACRGFGSDMESAGGDAEAKYTESMQRHRQNPHLRASVSGSVGLQCEG